MAEIYKNPAEYAAALTKRNHAGQQQPYVPAGNGDESGEYRDNAYGGGGSTESTPKPKYIPKPKEETPKEIPLDEGTIVEETPKEEKKMTKKEKVIYDNQNKFKKDFPNTLVNFKGFDEEAQNNLVESANKVKQDFPTLQRFLTEFGNPNAMTKEDKERAIAKELAKINDEAIDEYLARFRKWNPRYADDPQYDRAWARKQLEKFAQKPYVNKRMSIGKACAIAVHGVMGEKAIQTQIYYRDKYIGKEAQDFATHNYNSNWWSSNNKNSVAVHELGHSLDNYLFSTEGTRELRRQISDIYVEEQEKVRRKIKLAKEAGYPSYRVKEFFKEKLYNVSEYAMTNSQEFIAECVAAHYGGMNNPIAEKVFGIMKEAENIIQNQLKERGM